MNAKFGNISCKGIFAFQKKHKLLLSTLPGTMDSSVGIQKTGTGLIVR